MYAVKIMSNALTLVTRRLSSLTKTRNDDDGETDDEEGSTKGRIELFQAILDLLKQRQRIVDDDGILVDCRLFRIDIFVCYIF